MKIDLHSIVTLKCAVLQLVRMVMPILTTVEERFDLQQAHMCYMEEEICGCSHMTDGTWLLTQMDLFT